MTETRVPVQVWQKLKYLYRYDRNFKHTEVDVSSLPVSLSLCQACLCGDKS